MHYKEEHFSVDEVNEKVLLSFYLLSKGWQKLIMVTFPFDTSMFNRQLPILYTYNLQILTQYHYDSIIYTFIIYLR